MLEELALLLTAYAVPPHNGFGPGKMQQTQTQAIFIHLVLVGKTQMWQ